MFFSCTGGVCIGESRSQPRRRNLLSPAPDYSHSRRVHIVDTVWKNQRVSSTGSGVIDISVTGPIFFMDRLQKNPKWRDSPLLAMKLKLIGELKTILANSHGIQHRDLVIIRFFSILVVMVCFFYNTYRSLSGFRLRIQTGLRLRAMFHHIFA